MYSIDWTKAFCVSDIAVFRKMAEQLTGRVVAVAGDTVDITKDGLMINMALHFEAHRIFILTPHSSKWVDFQSLLLEGQIFMLGDNRPEASDSRIYVHQY